MMSCAFSVVHNFHFFQRVLLKVAWWLCLCTVATSYHIKHVLLHCRSYACPRPAFVNLREDQLPEPWPDHLQWGWLWNGNHLRHPGLGQRTGRNIPLLWPTYGNILEIVLSDEQRWLSDIERKSWFSSRMLVFIIKILKWDYSCFWLYVFIHDLASFPWKNIPLGGEKL